MGRSREPAVLALAYDNNQNHAYGIFRVTRPAGLHQRSGGDHIGQPQGLSQGLNARVRAQALPFSCGGIGAWTTTTYSLKESFSFAAGDTLRACVPFLLLMLAGTATGQVFLDSSVYTVGLDPLAVATADFNRDGRMDVVAANCSCRHSQHLNREWERNSQESCGLRNRSVSATSGSWGLQCRWQS